jgi:hypothetical protein
LVACVVEDDEDGEIVLQSPTGVMTAGRGVGIAAPLGGASGLARVEEGVGAGPARRSFGTEG